MMLNEVYSAVKKQAIIRETIQLIKTQSRQTFTQIMLTVK